MDAIDWSTAQRVGELLAGSPPSGAVSGESVQPLALRFAERVSEYSGLNLPAELPPLEAIDRPTWIAANLKTMRPLLEPLAEQASAAGQGRRKRRTFKPGGQDLTPLYDGLAAAGALLLGAQVGAMTGMLSQRVLGQYDLALLDPTVTPRLLLVAPNLTQAARTMQVDSEQLVSWVTIHELTHAIQFSGAPWLRAHLAGLLQELIAGLQVTVSLGALLRPLTCATCARSPSACVAASYCASPSASSAGGSSTACRPPCRSSRATPSTSWMPSAPTSCPPSRVCAPR